MATELETVLDLILNEKTNKIIPENIKAGVSILGITGTYEAAITPEEYNICDNLASLILGDTPIIDDPDISVTLDVSNNDSISINENALVIEEVTN